MSAGAARGGVPAAVALLGAALAGGACASNSQRVYAAPTRASGLVTASIDSVRGSPLHTRRIVLSNASTQPLIAYEVELYECRRVQVPILCGTPLAIDVLVPPGERRDLLRIESTDARFAPSYRYRYRWHYARNRQELDSLLAHAPPA